MSRVKIGVSKQDQLPPDRLRRLFSYDKDTGLFTWYEARSRVKAGSVAGSVNADGYLTICVDKSVYLAHRMAWAYVYGEWPALFVDHINGDSTDNRIENLRQVTHSQNQQNSKISAANTSGIRGVSRVASSGNWKAQIDVNGKRKVIGTFQTIEAAVAARKAEEAAHHTHRRITHV